jgi:hypothetical protein
MARWSVSTDERKAGGMAPTCPFGFETFETHGSGGALTLSAAGAASGRHIGSDMFAGSEQ